MEFLSADISECVADLFKDNIMQTASKEKISKKADFFLTSVNNSVILKLVKTEISLYCTEL